MSVQSHRKCSVTTDTIVIYEADSLHSLWAAARLATYKADDQRPEGDHWVITGF
jgi:hypothetical protein